MVFDGESITLQVGDTAKSYPALITAANPQPTTVAEESVPLAKVENTQPPTKKTSTSTVS